MLAGVGGNPRDIVDLEGRELRLCVCEIELLLVLNCRN